MYHIGPIWDARSSLCFAVTIVAMLVLIGIGVIMYNIFLHPASKFPGPTIAGATSLRYHWAMSTGNVAPWLREQHARYGEIVRIAPDMISYVNPDAWRDIYAYKPGKKEQNGIDWTIPSRDDDVPSMFSEANDAEHNRVRRLFLPAFSDRALKQQEPLLSKYSDQLIDLIRRGIDDNSNQEFDAVKLYNFTTFDIMGDLTFGEPLGLLKNSSYTEWVQNLFHDIKTVGIFLFIFDFPPLPWLVRKFSPPSIQRAHEIHKRHTVERVNRRLERGLDRPDIWNLVLSQPEGRGLTRAQMHANADIFMIAGTETTATLLSGLTYLLLKNPEKLQKLVKEIRGSFGSSEELTVENLARLPYLSACLSEGLRCYPPVPIGPSRLTPKTGAEVLGEHIPGRIRLTIPQCAAYYSELNFKDPYSFIPERWLPDTGYENDRKGILQPFLIGPRNCIGQNLAYHQMRLILCKVLWHYDIELCPDKGNWLLDQKMYIFWEKRPLMVKFIHAQK
uniref:Isotrichodermin C-15 hydroxylase (Cytochrome P-450 monooxygenase CYP65A1) n=1 Tax=Fusarium fujikuroi TaxID=5127 RepID=A0A7M4BLN1_FUSFU|nr:hypothetical protein [Fusarium fujikuroi]